MSVSNRGMALVLLSAATFGLMPVFARLAYDSMGFDGAAEVKTVLAIRFSVAAVCMWLLWAVLRRANRATTLRAAETAAPSTGERARGWRVLVPLVALGALGYVGQSFSYFTAASLISASATGLLLYTYPVMVMLMARIFYGEALTRRKLAALGVATLGALMVLGVVSSLLGGGEALGALNPPGVFWAVSAAVVYSLYIIAGTRFTRGVPPVFSSAVIITSAAVVYVVWGLVAGDLRLDAPPGAWGWALAIAIVCTVIPISTFFAGLRLVGPSRAAIISTVEPAVTVLVASIVLGERATPEQVAGGLLVLGAVLLLQWPPRRGRAASRENSLTIS